MRGIDYKLLRACEQGNLDEVVRLLAAGADANSQSELDETPLCEDIEQGAPIEIVKTLVDKCGARMLRTASVRFRPGHSEAVAIDATRVP